MRGHQASIILPLLAEELAEDGTGVHGRVDLLAGFQGRNRGVDKVIREAATLNVERIYLKYLFSK